MVGGHPDRKDLEGTRERCVPDEPIQGEEREHGRVRRLGSRPRWELLMELRARRWFAARPGESPSRSPSGCSS
jgi:hypothetical protein